MKIMKRMIIIVKWNGMDSNISSNDNDSNDESSESSNSNRMDGMKVMS